jgi:hypothetical protein
LAKEHSTTEFIVLDWLGCVMVILLILILFLWPIAVSPLFKAYKDFGGSLPILTVFASKFWFSPFFGIFANILFLLQWHRLVKNNLRRRRGWIVFTFIFALFAHGICVIAIYLPIIKIAMPI